MHGSLPDNNRTRFLPLLHAPRGALKPSLKVQVASERPPVPFNVHLILDRDRHPIKRPQGLPLLVSQRRSLRRRPNPLYLRLHKRDGVLPGGSHVTPDQG
jgi:hypothetical protein